MAETPLQSDRSNEGAARVLRRTNTEMTLDRDIITQNADGLREALVFLRGAREAMLEAGEWEDPMPDFWATNTLLQEIARRENRSMQDVLTEFRET